jgi:hypothetical protein
VKITRSVTEVGENGYFYTYVESGWPGGDSPHSWVSPRRAEYWYSYDRGLRPGVLRTISGKEWEVIDVKKRWRGLLPDLVTWRPKLLYR